jgi:tRNA/tmRNA/rRNA uracil-C5-methylase (TrmA/RlmC/RlmD family)
MQLRGHAAICSKFAAPLYGMKILKEGIETNKHNFTRFLLVCQPQRANLLRDIRMTNKASLVFTLPHEEGSLSQVLSILSFYKLNLTKIQSLPLVGKEWQYMFYIDLSFDDYTRYSQSIDAITPLTQELKILGEYQTKQTVYVSSSNRDDKDNFTHPNCKPLNIIKNFIINSSNKNDVILDTFIGSGTTAVACKETGRQYLGFEIDKDYFKIAQDRINGITKTGQTSLDLFSQERMDVE